MGFEDPLGDCYVSLHVKRQSIFKKRTFCFAGKQNCARVSTAGLEKKRLHVDQMSDIRSKPVPRSNCSLQKQNLDFVYVSENLGKPRVISGIYDFKA